MKHSKIFSAMALTLILSLMFIFIPSTPAYAAYGRIDDLDPDEGRIGDTIDLEGSDFISNNWYYLYFSSYSLLEGSNISDAYSYERLGSWQSEAGGYLYAYFTVPAELTDSAADRDVEVGTNYVYVTLLDGTIQAKDSFKVIGGEIDIYPTSGPVDTEVEIEGSGFTDDEEISVEYEYDSGTDDIDIEDGDDETDGDGDFLSYIVIPESTAGKHTITITINGEEAEAEFTITPEITLDEDTGAPGSEVTIYGTGFGKNKDITIYFDDEEVDIYDGDDDTDPKGSFETSFEVPEGISQGTYDVEVKDKDNNHADTEFSVAINMSITPTEGHVGTEITVNGNGFSANKTITVKYFDTAGSTALAQVTGTSNDEGEFTIAFNAPVSASGQHNVTVTDGSNSITKVFTMESTAPAVPTLVSPEDDTKVDSKPTLTWNIVTDDSGVTYSLQVYKIGLLEDGVTETMTILVDQTGLTATSYTLTDDEELESTEQEDPYYWRVKAIDGAANESDWSAPLIFYVGSFFNFPQLPVGAIIGICAAGFIPLGFWIGRRTAYQYY